MPIVIILVWWIVGLLIGVLEYCGVPSSLLEIIGVTLLGLGCLYVILRMLDCYVGFLIGFIDKIRRK